MVAYSIGTVRDMSAQWSNGAKVVNISNENGGPIVIKLPHNYIELKGIETVFDKKVITVRSVKFVDEVQKIVRTIRNQVEKDDVFETKIKEWAPVVVDKAVRASITKQTIIKPIGNVGSDSYNEDTLTGVEFTAYVVLTCPIVYFSEDTRKASIPVHVKSIGVVKVHDELQDVDVSKLTLAE